MKCGCDISFIVAKESGENQSSFGSSEVDQSFQGVENRFFKNIGAGCLPEPDRPLSAWHTEMVETIAALYDTKVYLGTCVVVGKGESIGYPRISIEAMNAELGLFENVDRDKGEALLAMSWSPDAPKGW